jgi:hypothetical protein
MDNILDIVERTRTDFDQKNVNIRDLSRLYQAFNPVPNIDMFVLEALKMFPELNCGLATVYLQSKLGGEIIKGKYQERYHTFLMLGDQIVDITADQYGGPRIYVGPLQAPWSR